MQASLFQLSKVHRQIKTLGVPITFIHYGTNQFKELDKSISTQKTVMGLYHEMYDESMSTAVSDSAKVRYKGLTYVMCLWDDVKNVSTDDKVLLKGAMYRIKLIRDIGKAKLIADVCIEEEQDDGKRV